MEYVHVLNRGVEKRDIVLDDSDRLRFIHDLFVFNDKNLVSPNHRLKHAYTSAAEREPLVRLHAYCLMKNHYHLLASEIDEGGISAFMRKLNMGYAKYFNEKYKRSGALWQGKYKRVPIRRDAHFLYIPYYIHLNPLDFKFPGWCRGELRDTSGALQYLEAYRWSSYRDYLGIHNFPSLLETSTLEKILGSPKEQVRTIKRIITDPAFAAGSNHLE